MENKDKHETGETLPAESCNPCFRLTFIMTFAHFQPTTVPRLG